jgi:hypothetical protein
MPFRHDADVFRPNGVSRRNFDGLKPPNPSSFGVRGVIGKKAEEKNPNRVSAKCAISRAFVPCPSRGQLRTPCDGLRSWVPVPALIQLFYKRALHELVLLLQSTPRGLHKEQRAARARGAVKR